MKLSSKHYPIIIVILSVILYLNTLGHDFVWDDKIVITENDKVQKGIKGIPDLFYKYNSDLRQDQYGYRPITLTSFAIDYTVFKGKAGGFHFMNILYYALLCFLLYRTLLRIFSNIREEILFLVVLIFVAHPLHVEVVANVKSRDEILAFLFGILSLNLFIKYYADRSKWWLIVMSIFTFFLAFFSKENAFTFLAVYPLVILVQKDFTWKNLIKLSWFFPVVGALAYFLLFTAYNSNIGAEVTADLGIVKESEILGNSFAHVLKPGIKLANAYHLILLYLGKFFCPYPLSYYSGYSHIEVLEVHWKVITGTVITLGSLVFAIIRIRKNPLISFGILFFFLTISIYLHLFRTLSDTMADRFAFIPSLGLCIVLIGVLCVLFKVKTTKLEETKSSKKSKNVISPISPRMRIVVLILVFGYGGLTVARNNVWSDDYTLVSSDIEQLDNCARAHYFLATELNKKMFEEGWSSQLEAEMIEHYQRSIELSDEIYYGRIELGSYLCNHNRIPEGIVVFEAAEAYFPEASDPKYYLGQAYFTQQRYQEAVEMLEGSLELASGYSDTYHLLALSYSHVGRYEEALFTAEDRRQKFESTDDLYYEELGYIYFNQGDLDQSTFNTLKAIDYGADAYKSYATVIGRYQVTGNDSLATVYYSEAISKGIMTLPQ